VSGGRAAARAAPTGRGVRGESLSVERHLSAKDIQALLGVSRSRAYEIAAQCVRVRVGERGVRVPESALKRWLTARTEHPYSRAVDADRWLKAARQRWATNAEAGPIRVTVPRTKPRPAAADGEPIRPIVPRTKPRARL
jgi:hypothetical protein